jgi:cytochrome c biogenesis protein CcmG/thiol:disulfide interchange protein DsbE
MTPRVVWTAVAGLATLAAVVLAIAVAEVSNRDQAKQAPIKPLTAAQVRARLAGSPRALAALHARGGELLPGNTQSWQAQLQALKGLPLVVNKWASWCVPCQGERAVLQHAAADEGRRVAFLGLDSEDTSRGDAKAFLRAVQTSYPSFYDESGELGRSVTDSAFTPVTVFYNSHGGRYIHQGPYTSVAALERDVERYALNA